MALYQSQRFRIIYMYIQRICGSNAIAIAIFPSSYIFAKKNHRNYVIAIFTLGTVASSLIYSQIRRATKESIQYFRSCSYSNSRSCTCRFRADQLWDRNECRRLGAASINKNCEYSSARPVDSHIPMYSDCAFNFIQ